MFVFSPKELTQAKQYIIEGNYKDSLQLLKDFEERESISLQDIVSCHLVKSFLLFRQGLFGKSTKLAEQAYFESLDLEKDILLVDSLLAMANSLYLINNIEKADKVLQQAEELLKSLKEVSIINKDRREAHLFYFKGMSLDPSISPPGDVDLAIKHYNLCLNLAESHGNETLINASLLRMAWNLLTIKGEHDIALDYIEKALALATETTDTIFITWALNMKGTLYNTIGDISRSIPLYKQSLAMAKELNHQPFISSSLNNMADAYRMNGELDQALECSKQCVEIILKIDTPRPIANPLDFLIQILIEKGDHEQAQHYFTKLEQINSQLEDKSINQIYLYNKALLLKESSRISNRGKAEEVLKQILKDRIDFLEIEIRILLTLCDLLISELQMTGDLEVLEEVESYIARLLEIAENSNSFWVWGEAYLLQAKLALISLNFEEARRLMTKGQKLAQKYSLNLLATKISNEHDGLLKQLGIWENLKNSKAPLNERIKLAGLNKQVENMIKRRVIDVSELSNEQPVFLLVVSEGGRPFFSQTFIEDQSFEDHLFGGFLSAINSFIGEMFSEGLDRVIFGEHTILVNSLSPFFICYVFKGQSYSAQQRVGIFIDKIQNDKLTWETFNRFYQLNKEVQLTDIPTLESLIKEIFVDRTILLTQ
ncbi:MAG: tetratricopeptide repeat protein [Promethearchaeota archaeon]|jgi:tetratricopeptide (TPR) repeat protein